jgi:hypothetical protein
MRAWLVVVAVLLGLVSLAGADAIQKWRTPSGSFYFGDHPPAGSTLVDTYADTPPAPSAPADIVPSSADPGLSAAAAEGREIIRQRQEQRAEEQRADQEREAREAEAAAAAPIYTDDPTWWIATGVAPCRVGENCVRPPHDGHHHHHHDGTGRPPGGNSGLAVVTPPLRPPPPAPPQSSGSSFGRQRGLR